MQHINEMWARLIQQYEQNAAENLFVLIDRYYQYAHTGNENMMTHLAKIEEMVGQLRDLGSSIDDNQVVSKVLMTLPPQYAHFRESWGLLPNTAKTKANLFPNYCCQNPCWSIGQIKRWLSETKILP